MMTQYLVKDLPVKFVKETIKAPLRLKGMQFFSDPNTPPPAEDTPPTEQTPPADDKEEVPIDGQKEPKLDDATKTFIEKMVQSAEDRVRSKYSKELNATKKELENYKTASMTAQEKLSMR